MYITKNRMEQGGNKWVIGGELEIKAGAVLSGEGAANLAAVATETTLGGVKAAEAGVGDTVEAKIGEDGKLHVPAYPEEYELPAATDAAIGGVLMAANVASLDAEANAATIVTAVNAILVALKAAGSMVDDE